jgi:hypothetical protein
MEAQAAGGVPPASDDAIDKISKVTIEAEGALPLHAKFALSLSCVHLSGQAYFFVFLLARNREIIFSLFFHC